MIVTLLSAILTLVVLPETIHEDDCYEFYRLCTEYDVYPNCKIIEQNDLVCYIATYPFDWEEEEEEQFKTIVPIYAAGIVSRVTSWHSDYVVVDFNNITMTFPTAMARELFAMVNLGYSEQEVGSFFLEYAGEYSSFNINYLNSPPPCTPTYSPVWRLVEEFDSQTAYHPNQASCHSNLRSLGSAEAMYYGKYIRYGSIAELVLSDIMANAGDLECPACNHHYSVSILDDGNDYRITCPNSSSHGSIEDGIVSWQ